MLGGFFCSLVCIDISLNRSIIFRYTTYSYFIESSIVHIFYYYIVTIYIYNEAHMTIVWIVSGSLKRYDCPCCRITSGWHTCCSSITKPGIGISMPSNIFMISNKVGTISPNKPIAFSCKSRRVSFGNYFFRRCFYK